MVRVHLSVSRFHCKYRSFPEALQASRFSVGHRLSARSGHPWMCSREILRLKSKHDERDLPVAIRECEAFAQTADVKFTYDRRGRKSAAEARLA